MKGRKSGGDEKEWETAEPYQGILSKSGGLSVVF